MGTVFAYKSDLDAWCGQSDKLETEEDKTDRALVVQIGRCGAGARAENPERLVVDLSRSFKERFRRICSALGRRPGFSRAAESFLERLSEKMEHQGQGILAVRLKNDGSRPGLPCRRTDREMILDWDNSIRGDGGYPPESCLRFQQS